MGNNELGQGNQPVASQSFTLGYFMKLIGLLFLGFILVSCMFGGKSSSSSEPQTESDKFVNAWYACKQNAERQLKSPSTAGFPSAYEVPYTVQNGGFDITGWVDAQNSFGAEIRTNFVCVARGDGVNYETEVIFIN